MASKPEQPCGSPPVGWTQREYDRYSEIAADLYLACYDWMVETGRIEPFKFGDTRRPAVTVSAARAHAAVGAGNDRAMTGEVVSVASLPPRPAVAGGDLPYGKSRRGGLSASRRLAADAPQRLAHAITVPPYLDALNTTNDQG